MRPPTRIPGHIPSPYDELAQLADPGDPFDLGPRAGDESGAGLRDWRRADDDDEPWSPPDHRGPGRLRGLSHAAKISLTLVAVLAFLVVADRAALLYAQDKAGDELQHSLGLVARPSVDIHGFPFLTQALYGRVGRVDVTVPDVPAGRVSLAEVHATAKNVRIVGGLPSSVKGAVIGSVDGSVLLSFDDMDRELTASQASFTDAGRDNVKIAGSLPVAGHDLRVHAEAHIRRDGGQGVATTVDDMRLDVPGLASYEPGRDRAHSGLRLAAPAARALADDTARAKALLGVRSVVKRLGVPRTRVDEALRGDAQLHRLTGSPLFVRQLMRVNLVDVVARHPWVLKKAGIDPAFVDALVHLRLPQLSDRLSLDVRLPKEPVPVRLRHVTVEHDGIRADLAGSGIRLGRKH
ncbi:LmeA family phospholipid-binding protein [Streptomyces sp. DW26H14]|uniref:LmeA family phospholipid-binding protein n=1 Tax=Streptomyces sp. DW26H14 TaxID=3435395 RepID=UPI00403DF747